MKVYFIDAGGGLVPLADDTPHYNITDSDLTQLHSKIEASIRSTLSDDVRKHVEDYVDKVTLL